MKRRNLINLGFGLLGLLSGSTFAGAAGLPPEEKPKLCDDACEKELENAPMVTTESGLQYKDIKVGGGPSPPVGFQITLGNSSDFDKPEGKSSGDQIQPYLLQWFLQAKYLTEICLSFSLFEEELHEIFNSLEKGQPYIFRVGSGQVIKGLDEGILTMKVGGKRRLYIPGPLAFPKGLTSAPGRPRVAANSPVVFDVSLEYIPGLEDE
ncbi:UNVERIFIED_CONTAM: Peptidyl-prolyl cis-trans isomerase FKBP16-3, chloroplastic [Sesamum radiatum]|uniref:peptidylprolyl isomerase n=1 Tax=Sesamum radiatum TaxID=300843 RepID=A0AAW2QFJ6_SESRA